ncbi:hypothetical protein PMAYCL1PPCAC_04534 [Pristionchus mayeri]|uniref:G protein-coupled receptor n=1 Tax=Pristionchus mayeri TaxID=1317129 RepID=A0AAN5C9Y5_9BILA|nr:hypothetical protein PMAYCL1PPCAC_04534 [Pristionchus mayeri]
MFEARKRCGLTFVNNTIGLLSMHFAFRKHHPILEAWNRAMVYNQQFIVKTFDKYMRDGGLLSNPHRCREVDAVTSREGTALSMTDVAGAFVFFVVLCDAAFAIMGLEVGWNGYRRRRKCNE